ncbi:MAG: hypothetical protein QF521_01175 [Alphaproteobacteria bacterium]|jgi:sugar (pentulose or hexulose) kinase|nr:hypothetical protein [Alphaproteobacteria bacterium]MDP6872111.1 hypothetical protein [Alphaproteobacteria bacterium]
MSSGDEALFLGLDAGTSGMRGVCVDQGGEIVAAAKTSFDDEQQARLPKVWRAGIARILDELASLVALDRIRGIAVDGQSGTG